MVVAICYNPLGDQLGQQQEKQRGCQPKSKS
jgi:hypothetical protein